MKIPFLHNVRRGLATNSSSSHSMVFHAERKADDRIESAGEVSTEFGWDHFVLDSLGAKLVYALTNQIGENWYATRSPEEVAQSVKEARDQYGHLFPELDKDAYWVNAIQGYVDHQSRTYGLSEEFMAKVRDPKVVIHGGNDNDGYPNIEWEYDEATGKYNDKDVSLPEGATRESLG